ncbi:MAG: DUF6629 family protein [Saprospiraceae bacterium]
MCFSAVSSISAGVVLSGVGVFTLKKAGSTNQIIFASIPLLFAIQQLTEGVLWIALSDPAYANLQQVSTYNFLFFAQIIWPIWVPLGVLKMELPEHRGITSKIMVGLGFLVSFYLGYCLLNYPVNASIMSYHISYDQQYPAFFGKTVGYLYVIATVVPLFVSRIKYMWAMGTAIAISLLITAILYTDYIISVWCFFASVISIIVLIIIILHNNTANGKKER